MDGWSLQFEPPDLARWIWLAVGAVAAGELVRYVLAGSRPRGLGGRLVASLLIAAALMAGWAGGLGRAVASSHGTATLLLGILAFAWLGRSYRRTTRNIAPRERRALLTLRALAAGVVLILLARPVLQHVTISRERAALAILLDDSKSMQIRDVQPDGSPAESSSAVGRLDVLKGVLRNNAHALEGLSEDLDIHWFKFADSIRETTGPQVRGEGDQTALAGAVERTRELLGQAGTKPAGVIVISDGRDNLSSDEERRAAGEWLAVAGVPLYAVGVGSEVPAGARQNLLVRRLEYPPSVSVLNRLPVQAELLATGLAGGSITVELLFDDDIVDMRKVQPAGPQEVLRVELVHTPVSGGLHRVGVRARASGVSGPESEAILSQFVRVTDDKIQVLYIDRPRYERAAIARALEAAKELRVTKVDLARPAESALSGLPQSSLEWRAYHVVLIGDIDRRAFPAAGLTAIRELAENYGRGVAMLGGLRTLGGGQYAGTSLSRIMPVSLAALGELAGPLSFELTPAGKRHSICRMAAETAVSEAIWKKLPPLDGAGRLGGLKPTAEVLLEAPGGEPLVVVSETGKGRAAAVAFDSTWRWPFAGEKGLEAQRRFWRQLVLWLANRRPEVWVACDRPRYDLVRLRSGSDKVILRAGVTDPTTGRTPESATLAGTLTGPDGQPREIRWIQTTDAMEARLVVSEPGEYRVSVSAQSGDQKLGESETAFVVAAADPELADPSADLENLRRLAARTRGSGGEYYPIAEFGKLLERLAARPHAAEIRQIRRVQIVDDWPWGWFAVFVGLLTVEWVFRRRAGLV